MQPAAILSVLVTANTGAASRSLLKFNATMRATESSSNKALGAVNTFAKGAAIGIGGALAYSVKKAADFEQQLDSLGAVTDANARTMERFRKQALKAGADTKFSALDAAVAQTELAKGGLSVANIMKGGLRSALSLAAAGELDLGDAAATTVNAMKQFGLQGKQSMRVADALATAANRTTADVGDFAIALKQGGGAAHTAGLSFTETVAALEALAEGGVKGSDAGTSLRTTMAQLATPTAKAQKLMNRLNLDFFDSAGNMKSLVDISAMLSDRFSGLTREQRLHAAATIVGQDGMRTLISLFTAGPDKIAKFEEGLRKQGTAAEVAAKKQDNLKGKLENLRGSVETLAITFGSKLLPVLTKAAEDITDVLNDRTLTSAQKFQKLGDMLGKAIADAGPTIGKAMAGLAVIGVRSFFEAFRNSPLWLKLVTGAFIISKLGGFRGVSAAGAKAGAAYGAGFATAAQKTMAAGNVAAVGQLGRAGQLAHGKQFRSGAPVSQLGARQYGLAAVGSGLAAQAKKLAPQVRAIGKNVLGFALVAGIADAASRQGISGFGDRFQQAASTGTFGLIPAPRDIDERLRTIADKIRTWRGGMLKLSDASDPDNSLIRAKDLDDFSARQRKMLSGLAELRNTATQLFGKEFRLNAKMEFNPEVAAKRLRMLDNEFGRLRSGAVLDVKQLRQVTASNFKLIAETMGARSRQGQEAVAKNFQLGLQNIRDFKQHGVLTTKQAMGEVARLLKVNSGAGKNALKANFAEAVRFIAKSMGNGVTTTEKATGLLRQIFARELRLYGLSKESIRFRLEGKEQSGKTIGAPHVNKQRGGHINIGKPSGDSVPAVLEKGEYVLNRNAVKRVGTQKLDALNFGAAKRFQAGGLAGMVSAANRLDKAQFPYLWGGGHQGSPAPFGPMDCSGAVSYVLQHGGVQIPTMVSGALMSAGQPGPGRVTVFANPTHTFMRIGNRYFGTSGANPGGGAGWFPDPGQGYRAGFAQRHFRAGAGGLGEVPALTVAGPDSPLRTVVQAAVSGTRAAANRRLQDLMASSIGAGDSGDPGPFGGGGSSAANLRLGRRMAAAYGWIGAQWAALRELWQRESGWNNMARNPSSGAFGIPQALPPTKMPLAAQRGDAASQIAWGLQYIQGQYGSPASALSFHNAHNWYALGGLVGMAEGGGARLSNPHGPSHGVAQLEDGKKKGQPGLGKLLNKTLKALHSGGKAKQRGQLMKRFLKGLKSQGGLPASLANQLQMLSGSATNLGDYADKASQLNVENDDGTTQLGVFRGKNEQQWLTDQLGVLFKWRNKLVDAIQIVQKRRAELAKMVAKVKDRIKRITAEIKSVTKHQNARRKLLTQLRKKPKQNKTQIASLRKVIMRVEDWLGGRTKERTGLQKLLGDPSSGGLLRQRSSLGTLYGDLSGSEGLEGVQGPGGPMGHLKNLPALGTLGGSIFDVQLRLRDLATPKQSIADNSPVTDETQVELLKQLLREANLRTAVSEAQFKVLRDFDATSGLGQLQQFATGGIVQAPAGQPLPVIAHGGEGVFTRDQMAAMGGSNVRVVINGDVVNVPRGKQPVEVHYGDRRFDRAVGRSRVSRRLEPLPGRGGGGL